MGCKTNGIHLDIYIPVANSSIIPKLGMIDEAVVGVGHLEMVGFPKNH